MKVSTPGHIVNPLGSGRRMESKQPINCLRTHRRCWAFDQEEIARLLGFKSGGTISRIEQGKCVPGLEAALALEVLFGVAPKDMFPHIYAETAEALMRRAVAFNEATLQNSTSEYLRKRECLKEALGRATKSPNTEGV